MKNQVLFVGGSGIVGSHAVKSFRARHPDLPILIGGRDMEKASAVAREVGSAQAVEIDLDKPRLGLNADIPLSAVVMMTPDEGLKALSFAQDMRVPYLSIGNWLVEIGAELAHFAHRPDASPVVLNSEWLGGPAVFLTLATARGLDTVRSVKVGAILDTLDPVGPIAMEDMERAGEGMAGALAFEDGRRVWLSGVSARRSIETIDGRSLEGNAMATYDIATIHAATGAANVRVDLAADISSSRLRGSDTATEIIVEIEGEVRGSTKQRRSTIEFNKGQAALTGLSLVLSLSTALGLEGGAPAAAGLYFPELLMDADWFLDELVQAGGTVVVDTN